MCISSVKASKVFPFILCLLSLPLLPGRTNAPCFFLPMLQPVIRLQLVSNRTHRSTCLSLTLAASPLASYKTNTHQFVLCCSPKVHVSCSIRRLDGQTFKWIVTTLLALVCVYRSRLFTRFYSCLDVCGAWETRRCPPPTRRTRMRRSHFRHVTRHLTNEQQSRKCS